MFATNQKVGRGSGTDDAKHGWGTTELNSVGCPMLAWFPLNGLVPLS